MKKKIYFYLNKLVLHTHAHTHAHTYIYIQYNIISITLYQSLLSDVYFV